MKTETVTCNGMTYPVLELEVFGQKEKLFLIKDFYADGGGLAVNVMSLLDEEEFGEIAEPYGCLTVNIPGYPTDEQHAFLKTYSENEEWAERLARAAGAEPTGFVLTNNYGTKFPLYDFSKVNFIKK